MTGFLASRVLFHAKGMNLGPTWPKGGFCGVVCGLRVQVLLIFFEVVFALVSRPLIKSCVFGCLQLIDGPYTYARIGRFHFVLLFFLDTQALPPASPSHLRY